MELDPQTKSRVWWQGASMSAIKGIPQGLLLGLIGFAVLTGIIFGVGALGGGTLLVNTFGGFLFGNAGNAATAAVAGEIVPFISALNPITFVALNTVLTAVGNFLTGGDLAVAQHRQQIDHEHNNARIRAIEGREQQVEQVLQQVASRGQQVEQKLAHHMATSHAAPETTPRHVQKILEEGPKVKVDKEASASHAADVVADRLEAAEHAIH